MIDGDLERWMERPVSRREVFRRAGRGALGASALAAFLAACGRDEEPLPRTTLPPVAGELSVAQWPLYIDRARGGARPTLEAFEQEHDIEVKYREVISDNQQFFATLVPFF
ncbi:MAG: spermidine/putrescine ABC transporter substrate-binding protein, partial [Actinomycetota bacterium]